MVYKCIWITSTVSVECSLLITEVDSTHTVCGDESKWIPFSCELDSCHLWESVFVWREIRVSDLMFNVCSTQCVCVHHLFGIILWYHSTIYIVRQIKHQSRLLTIRVHTLSRCVYHVIKLLKTVTVVRMPFDAKKNEQHL